MTLLLSLTAAATLNIRRMPADGNFLFPTGAKRLTKFMMEQTYGECRPFTPAWAQRVVLDGTAESDIFGRLGYYEEARANGRACGSIFIAENDIGELCGFADVGASLWLPNDQCHRLPLGTDLQRLATTGRGADGQVKKGVELRPYVSNLVVDASLRRSGVGRRLMEACEEDAASWQATCRIADGPAADDLWLEVTSTNRVAVDFYDAIGYRSAGITTGSEVTRQGDGFGMADVERLVLRKALRLKGGFAPPSLGRRRCVASLCSAAALSLPLQRAAAFPPPAGNAEFLVPLLQCRDLLSACSATVSKRGATTDWGELQRTLNQPPITNPAGKGGKGGKASVVVGSAFRAASVAYDESLKYVAELDEADRAFCYVSKAVKVDEQCVQRLYTSDRTYRELLRNSVLTELQQLEGEADYLALCAQQTRESSGPVNPRNDAIRCSAELADEAQQEVRRLLDSTLASLDKFFASIRTGEISAARRSIAQ